MQTPNGFRGYSEFFTSGFRAVTNRPRRFHHAFDDHPHAPLSSTTRPTSRRTFSDITHRQHRPSSIMAHGQAPNATREKRARRASIISFSSRLFERMTTHERASTSSGSRRSSRSSLVIDLSGDENAPEIWITAGGPYTPSAPNGSAPHQPIDPFMSSPDSRSFFIDLSSENSPTGTPKHESFLSLTGSSSTLSSLILPPRRERPTSIHTMPLPSRSRRSSFQYPAPSQEKLDFFLMTEDEPTGNFAIESIAEDQEWDAPAKIDWHQFHIDILTDDSH